MKRFLFYISYFCIFILASQNGIKKINELTEKLKADPDLKHAVFSFCVADVTSGKILQEYNSNLSLVPASTLKTLTTGAALGILGKNFRYETQLLYTGKFDSVTGIINGDLIVRGSGDPTLNSRYFKKNKEDSTQLTDEWALLLKQKGVKKINGKVIADNSCFENDVPGTWIWADIGNYFGAPANGLSYNDNKFSLYFKSGAAGTQTQIVSQQPVIPGLFITNKVIAGGTEDNAFIYGAPGVYDRVIKGTIPPNQSTYEVEGALPDPAFFCVNSLISSLKKNGIEVSGAAEVSGERIKTKSKLLHTHKSPTLDKIVYYTNMKSNNHYAETLLKTVAWKKNGYGTTGGGTEVILNFWKERGVDIDGLFMSDGSGLSRSNAISTLIQAKILGKIYKDTLIRDAFNASLPVSGKSGGMVNLGKGTCAEGNMRAKSGYINRARAYCGFVKNKNGSELVFSVIFNNYSCSPKEVKEKIEDLLVLFCEL